VIKSIALFEPTTDIPNLYSLTVSPRLGLPAIGSILKEKGYQVDIFIEKIKRPSVKELLDHDLVGISVLTNSCPKGYAYADKLRKHGLKVVLGGPHVTFLPEDGLRHADFVVRGEGEETLPELIDALNKHKPLGAVQGLSYRENGLIRHNPERDFGSHYLDVSPDFGLIKGVEQFSRGPLSRYRFIPMVYTSRGCPLHCRYCTIAGFAGRKPRYRPLTRCLKDIGHTLAISRKDIGIADDNFTMDIRRTKTFLKGLISLRLSRQHAFMTQIKVNAFKDGELLALLRDANFELLHVGYESISDHTLREWKKEQSLEDMFRSVDQAKKYHLKINGMFVVGSDHDTEETVQKTTDFAIETDLAVMQMCILTPLPGSDIFRQTLQENRIFNRQWRHYDCQHSVFFPRHIRPSWLQRAVRTANNRFYSFKRMFLHAPGNRITYGINAHRMDQWMRKYEKKLKRVEEGFYSEEHLLQEKISRLDYRHTTRALA
jgi:anaerobic magnesium-protoporphyrin IX monomethyl ester cyclase